MLPSSSPPPDQDAALLTRIRARFQDKDYRPPLLPAVALEVHRISQDPKADFAAVAKVLEQDALLAARVLRMARSAAFGRATQVGTLQDAMARLGLKTISDVVWEAAFSAKVFRAPRYVGVMEKMRQHATATAYLSRLISRMTPVSTEYAFLCGLVHDIGLAAALIVLGEKLDDQPEPPVLAGVLAPLHEELSGLVARLWNLPPDVQIVLANHHSLKVGEHIHPLSAIIAVAETLANEAGRDVTFEGVRWDRPRDEGVEGAFKALQIGAPQQKTLLVEAKKVLEALPSD
jgi:HD-like signal output (HDOD) protein